MSAVPHFALPFRFSNPQAASNEQDSLEEIADAVLAILVTQVGFRVELPGFGIDDPTFAMGHVDLEQLRAAAESWEPRASTLWSQYPDLVDELLVHVGVNVSVRSTQKQSLNQRAEG
jgi:phage baseplate assembly protein W